MERKIKCKKLGFSTILWAVAAIMLCALPCDALVVVPSAGVDNPLIVSNGDTINDSVTVNTGGTLNLLDGGEVNGQVTVNDGGILNLNGGSILVGVYTSSGSEVNITGGSAGALISVVSGATVTVYGPKFDIDSTKYDPPQDIAFRNYLKTLSFADKPSVDLN